MIKLNYLDLLFLISLFFGIIQIFNTYLTYENWFTAFNGFRLYYSGIFFYFLVRLYVRDKKNIKPIVTVMLISFLIVSTEMVAEFILLFNNLTLEILPWYIDSVSAIGEKPLLKNYSEAGFVFIKSFGLLTGAQLTATFIGMGLMISSVFILKRDRTNRTREIFTSKMPFFLFLFISLLLASSRAVIFSFIFCFLSLIILGHKKPKDPFFLKSIGYILIGCIFVLVLLAFDTTIGGFLLKDFLEYNFKSVVYGEAAYYEYIRVEYLNFNFLEFLTGVGFTPSSGYSEPLKFHSGSEMNILNLFFQLGLIGSSLFILQVLLSVKIGLKAGKNEPDPFYKFLYIGFSWTIVMVTLSLFHYFTIINPSIQCYYYGILGIIGSLPSLTKTQSNLIN